MILSCPSCRTRYIVPDSAIGIGGRKVRCAQCRFSWFQDGPELPDRPATPLPPPPAAPAPRRAPRPEPRPAPEPESTAQFEPEAAFDEPAAAAPAQEETIDWAPDESPQEEPRRRRRNPARLWTWIAILAALLMVGALAAIYFVGPQQISAWMSGDSVSATGERLRFTRRDVMREPLPTDKDLLTVTGEITNVSGEVQSVPQIRADVTDTEQRVIFSWTIAPPVNELQPGQAITFSSASTDVPKGGRNLNLSFGPG